ncbi:MAG: FeoB-associated Cys-rich membrane protein [Planctomycetaceae bacterium]|jgi:hypothetical protein|nr:FeoB-associated Cys-rich membrane protein [Planctomycetaceae bacterium]
MTWFGIIVGGIALAAVAFFLRKEAKNGSCGSCCGHCGLHDSHSCNSHTVADSFDSTLKADDESDKRKSEQV